MVLHVLRFQVNCSSDVRVKISFGLYRCGFALRLVLLQSVVSPRHKFNPHNASLWMCFHCFKKISKCFITMTKFIKIQCVPMSVHHLPFDSVHLSHSVGMSVWSSFCRLNKSRSFFCCLSYFNNLKHGPTNLQSYQ